MADAVSMFAVLPEYSVVSTDWPAGAGGPGLCARGVPHAEAAQTGRLPGAVWPAAGRGRAPVRCPPLPAAACRLSTLQHLARAAEAADPPSPADDRAAHRRAAAPALGY